MSAGKFDAAGRFKYSIDRLEGSPNLCMGHKDDGEGCGCGDNPKQQALYEAMSADYQSAIRVLEAAGKVDKELALRLFEDCYATASVQRYGEVKIGDLYRAIRALLNALPDEVTK
jgi:hypothetical protein